MENKENEIFVKIEESKEDFNFWINKDFISEGLKETLRESNALILPDEGFRERKDIYFPVGTTELYQYLQDKKDENFKPEICFGDEDYKELALHSEIIIIGTFIVTNVALPFLINYLYDYFKNKWGKPIQKNVKVKLYEQKGDTVRKFTYEGPAEDFDKHILKALKEDQSK